ncbi:hypothetical protein BBK14_08010 [Parafrankia soli]|uniref:Uncharacterized protein n=1 Tax=Parafrankia soli TaxID=2599596 RepID=A0A1S1PIY3_9ACTN|nr:hypothetical protein BBK14_08010 [Parafrankia soli]
MISRNDERGPLDRDRVRTDQHTGDGADRNHRTPRWAPGIVERERARARLRRMADAAGRPLRTRHDEAEHADRRRAGELARIARVGE